MKVKHQGTMRGDEKEFLDLFQKLCYSRSSWQVWADLMCVMACAISNAVDIIPAHREPREKEYEQYAQHRIDQGPLQAKHVVEVDLAKEIPTQNS